MAKAVADSASLSSAIIRDVRSGVFSPVYLLMGEEPYYVDITAGAIISAALNEDERDFNQFIMYGAESTVEDVVGNARRYPMFAERNVVVLREAQAMKGIENLTVYTDKPLESTVLLLIYRGKMDKRTSLYKSIERQGRVLESVPVRDYKMPEWIAGHYAGRGLRIAPDAAMLLAEYTGTDLGKVAVETDKLLKNLPEGVTEVTVGDIASNVGISREFNVFELTRQLSYRQRDRALRTAAYMGGEASFSIQAAVAGIFFNFNRLLRYEALLFKNPRATQEEKLAALGVNPYFLKEYEAAARNYPLKACMQVIAILRDYDFKSKSGGRGESSDAELLTEMVTKILYV